VTVRFSYPWFLPYYKSMLKFPVILI